MRGNVSKEMIINTRELFNDAMPKEGRKGSNDWFACAYWRNSLPSSPPHRCCAFSLPRLRAAASSASAARNRRSSVARRSASERDERS